MALPAQKITPQEYLALESRAAEKSEYHDGETFAMAGASPEHALVVTNLVTQLNVALLDEPCVVFSSDLQLRVDATGLYTYPDVAVACGDVKFEDDQLKNPVVLFEVLSKNTQDYDRGSKFAHYRSIPSLMDYVLVAQDKFHVEHFTRKPGNMWLLAEIDGLESEVRLPSIKCSLKLQEIYRKYDLLRPRTSG